MQPGFKALFFFCLAGIACSCTSVKNISSKQTTTGISSIKLLGQYDVPFNLNYNNTTVGGLSGIDYDAVNNLYYFICDDRSAINPARFYTAKISITPTGIDTLYFTGVQNLLQPGGDHYPGSLQDPIHTPDPEAIRYNPLLQQLTWSSEGERRFTKTDTILQDPEVNIISLDGKYVDAIKIPTMLRMQKDEAGPRQNGTLEGMTFANNYQSLFLSMEEPLYEDGPRADTFDSNAFIRIMEYDVNSKINLRQFAYKLEPVAYPALPSTAFKINGVPDILAIGNGQLLIIERSFSSGRLPCTIRLYIADYNKATDIKGVRSLKDNTGFTPATKKLLLNMDELGIYTDNIEGVCFGPILPNGNKTLIFIADNNFNPLERTQVFVFEILK